MKTLALDFDGVIADSDPAKAVFAREELGLDLDERLMKQRRFIELFGEDEGRRLYADIIRGLYGSARMLTDVRPMPGAREGMAQLRAWGYRCVVLTSRYGSMDDGNSLAGWAWRFLGHHRFQVVRADFYNVDDRSKLGVCLATGAQWLVDDDYAKLAPVIEAGLQGYLFSTQTNENAEMEHDPFLALRVRDWRHLLEILSGERSV